jgi:hypothetical protein
MLFRYAIKTALARRLFAALIIGAIALVVAGSALTLAFVHGIISAVSVGAHPRNVIVLTRDIFNLTLSVVSNDTLNAIKAQPEVEVLNGVPLVSPEFDTFVSVGSDLAPGRAVDEVALLVHDHVRIVSGRAPVGQEVMVGQQLVQKHPGLAIGSTVGLNIPGSKVRHAWPVVGIFTDGGHHLERAVWFPRKAYLVNRSRGTGADMGMDQGYLVVRLRSTDDVRPFIERLSNSRAVPVAAFLEQAYYDEMLGRLNAVMPVVFGIMFVLIAVAISMVSNLLHASMASRRTEFFTLWSMGFRPASLKLVVLTESTFYASVGTVLGTILTIALTTGRDPAALLGGGVQFTFSYTALQLGELAAVGVLIAVLSTLYPLLLVRVRALANER